MVAGGQPALQRGRAPGRPRARGGTPGLVPAGHGPAGGGGADGRRRGRRGLRRGVGQGGLLGHRRGGRPGVGLGLHPQAPGGVGAGAPRPTDRPGGAASQWTARARSGTSASSPWSEPASPTAARCSAARSTGLVDPRRFVAAGIDPTARAEELALDGVGAAGGGGATGEGRVGRSRTDDRGASRARLAGAADGPGQAHPLARQSPGYGPTVTTCSNPRWSPSTWPTRSRSRADGEGPGIWPSRRTRRVRDGVGARCRSRRGRTTWWCGRWRPPGAPRRVHLVKRIPPEPGSGGIGRRRCRPPVGRLHRPDVAASAWAPTCRSAWSAGRAVVRGIGEAVEPLPYEDRRFTLLLLPPFGVDTAAVYRAWDRLAGRGGRAAGHGRCRNDLEAAACVVEPRLAAVAATASRSHRATGPPGRKRLDLVRGGCARGPGPGRTDWLESGGERSAGRGTDGAGAR